ncbi:MAG TPA: SpoIIE family protein phosphatase, partial [Candidatus Sumerlaeota bacterium]|nr:SpoIIE family protein phosphatase [Candidatus Sumerlaeota bacterium]
MSKNILTLIIIILFAAVIILKKRIRFLRVYSETRMKEREAVISFLHKIGERITHSIDLQGSLEIITNFIVEYTHAESGAIFLLNEEENALRAKVVIGLFPPLHQTTEHAFTKRKFLTERIMRDKVNLGEGIIGYVAQSGITQLITDPQNDPRVPQTSDVSIASLMVAPLKIKDKVLGVMALANKRDGISFDERDKSLLESLSDQAAVTVDIVKLYDQLAKQQRIEQELRVAHDFQKLLLPKECPSVEGLDMAAISEPALEVGGDYYDFFWVDEDHLGVVIADVSGKGIPGALVMSMLRSALRAESRNILSPAAVLKVINEYIRTDTQVNVFITAIYAIIDIRT